MELFLILICIILMGVIIYFIIKINNYKNKYEQIEHLVVQQTKSIISLESEVKNQTEKVSILSKENTSLISDNKVLQERLIFQKEEISLLHKQTTLQFEQIAQKLLEEKSERFTLNNNEQMNAILKPLNENIERFKKQVEETYDKESKLRFSLEERIKDLMLQTNKISSEANNLANALKTNHKKQGDWGELILENLLERAGLVKNREFVVQSNLVTAEGKNLRPDIIVNLPNNRAVIIDSKVSLNAYDSYCNTEQTEDQVLFLNDHLKAIRYHIDDLSSKNYHNLVEGLDFTLLFIPIEPAYLLAIQNDNNLWNEAYKKRILLISPTNLIACLKLISDLWNRDKQDKSAQKIVQQAEKIYEKTVLFTKSFEQVGKQLQQAQDVYLRAQNQLKDGRGNILSQTNKLLKYGLAPKNVLTNFYEDEDVE